MIVDLQHKQWFLLSIFPLIFWCTLLPNFSFFYLVMAIIGAIVTGFNFAFDEFMRGIERIEKVFPDQKDYARDRYLKTMQRGITQKFYLILLIFGLYSFFYMQYFVITHLNDTAYYVWMIFFLTWATVFYQIFLFFFIPEYLKAAIGGFKHGWSTRDKTENEPKTE